MNKEPNPNKTAEIKFWLSQIFDKLKHVKTIEELNSLEKLIPPKKRMKSDNLHEIAFSIIPDEIDLLRENGLMNDDFTFPTDISARLTDPITKLLFAISWKNRDLNKIKHIVYGIYNSKQNNIIGGDAIVFRQFGKFIANKNKNPIIDQHVIRAYLSFEAKDDDEFLKAQKLNVIKKKHSKIVSEYIDWLESEFFKNELKNDPKFKYYVDKLLFGIGKCLKIKH